MPVNRTERARSLRQSSGLAEDRVWTRLRGGCLDGHKFRRQHPIGAYVVDFACDRLRLVIEVDGGVHGLADVALKDVRRQAVIEGLGWTVLRFTNDEVLLEVERLSEAVRGHARALE